MKDERDARAVTEEGERMKEGRRREGVGFYLNNKILRACIKNIITPNKMVKIV